MNAISTPYSTASVPGDLRNFSAEQLRQLADEIAGRDGGRGVGHGRPPRRIAGGVELTVAIHAIFDTPRDGCCGRRASGLPA